MNVLDYGAFLSAILIFQLIPGPGTLTILGTTAQYGVRAGLASVAGTVTGGLLCMAATIGGLQVLLQGQPEMICWLQWLGAAYLAWMGAALLRRRRSAATDTVQTRTLGQHARQALGVSLANPKVILFYFALFPLFLRPDATPATYALMAAHVTGISVAYQCLLVLAGNSVAGWLRTLPSVREVGRALMGAGLIAFALVLAAGAR